MYYSVGKWNLGLHELSYTPTSRGFQTSYGILSVGCDLFDQRAFTVQCFDESIPVRDHWVNDSYAEIPLGTYNEQRYTSAATRIIDNHAKTKRSRPMFMYIASQATHVPIKTTDEFKKMYPNVTYELQKEYYGMVSMIDSMVHNVTMSLKRNGMWNNTLFIWASDNGAPIMPFDGNDLWKSACGSNWPLRGGKGTHWEGGVRVPGFISGGYLPHSQRGKRLKGMVHLVDWYATILGLAGLIDDDNIISPVDGVDLWPWLRGAVSSSPRKMMVYHHSIADVHNRSAIGALRVGRYKLMMGSQILATWYGGPENNYFSPNQSVPIMIKKLRACDTETPCIFDVDSDPTEHVDISSRNKALLDELIRIWDGLFDSYHPPGKETIKIVDHDLMCASFNASNYFIYPYLNFTLSTSPIKRNKFRVL